MFQHGVRLPGEQRRVFRGASFINNTNNARAANRNNNNPNNVNNNNGFRLVAAHDYAAPSQGIGCIVVDCDKAHPHMRGVPRMLYVYGFAVEAKDV